MSAPPEAEVRADVRAPGSPSLRLWMWNVVLAAVLHLRFLRGIEPLGAEATLFLALGLVSNAFVLSLVPAVVAMPLALLLRPWLRLRRVLLGLVWTLFLAAIWIDGNIWGLFRYHFNGLVWATVTNPAAGDAVHISGEELAVTLLALGLVWAFQVFSFQSLERRAPGGFRVGNKVAFLVLLLPLTLVEKALYAHADLVRDRRVTAIARVFPMYQRLTVKRIAVKHFGLDLNERPRLDLKGQDILLRYPLAAPLFGAGGVRTPSGKRPNIAIFVVDSLRADALTEELMPRTLAFAASHAGRRFEDHFSSGNATRFGVFGLLYSLHGSYWIPVSTEETPPVLVESLVALGYDMGVFSTASMNYPEFRSTAWVNITDDVHDELPGASPDERDFAQIAAIDDFLAQREGDAPFFLFSLLDAPHQVYSFPEESALFRPYTRDVNYTKLAGGANEEQRLELKNSYKNAVHFADDVLGQILAVLEARGELEDTLVIITGDHGEEFWESGFFGHTSNFTAEQVHVPFVFAGPGVPAGIEHLPTSHLDVVPTLLELLGADPSNRADWALGSNLLTPPGPEIRRIVSGWDQLALEMPDGILIVPTEVHRGFVEGKTLDWKDLYDDGPLIDREGGSLGRLALEQGRFLR